VVIDNAVAYLEAEVTQEIDVGTHTIFVVAPLPRQPLLILRRRRYKP
jgi:hypothetical protein